MAGCAVGFSGVLLANITPQGFGGGELSLLGEGLLLLAPVAYALSSGMLKNYSQKEDPMVLSGYQFMAGGAVMAVAGAVLGGSLSPQRWTAFAVLGYLSFLSAAAYSIWGLLLKFNPVSKVSVFSFLNPIVGVVLSALLLRESLAVSWVQCAAALALVSGGIYIINRPEKAEA